MLRSISLICLAFGTTLGTVAQTATPPAHPAADASSALPPGPGKAIAVRMCQACHGLDVVTAKRATPDDWAATVQLMVSRGADGTDEEIDTLTKYLSASFPAKDGKTITPPPPSGVAAPPTSHLDHVDPRFLTRLAPARGM